MKIALRKETAAILMVKIILLKSAVYAAFVRHPLNYIKKGKITARWIVVQNYILIQFALLSRYDAFVSFMTRRVQPNE
jgi:hypothetical protein